MEAQQVKQGETAKQPDDPTRDGFTFAGWYQDGALSVRFDFAAPITADATAYASWTEIEAGPLSVEPDTGLTGEVTVLMAKAPTAPVTVPSTYTVTVTTDGHGTASASVESSPEGTEVTLTATPNEGYRLKEWQVVSGGVTVIDNKFMLGSENVEVKAIFAQNLRQTRRLPQCIMEIYGQGRQRRMAQILPERFCSFY